MYNHTLLYGESVVRKHYAKESPPKMFKVSQDNLYSDTRTYNGKFLCNAAFKESTVKTCCTRSVAGTNKLRDYPPKYYNAVKLLSISLQTCSKQHKQAVVLLMP